MAKNIPEIPLNPTESHNGTIGLMNRISEMREQGKTWDFISKKVKVPKTTLYRWYKKGPKEQEDNSLSEGSFSAFPNEPIEFLSDQELRSTSKRLKLEISIKRDRARSAWLDYVSKHPEQYQSQHQRFDGEGREEKRSAVERRSDAFIEKILITKMISGSNQLMGPKELISFASNLKALFSSDAKADDFWTKMQKFKTLEEGVIKERQEIQDRANKIASARVDKGWKREIAEKLVGQVEKIPEILGGLKAQQKKIPPPPQTPQETTETMIIKNPEELANMHLPVESSEQIFPDGGELPEKPKSKKKKPTPAKEIPNNIAEKV